MVKDNNQLSKLSKNEMSELIYQSIDMLENSRFDADSLQQNLNNVIRKN